MNIFDIYLDKIKNLIIKLNNEGLIEIPKSLQSVNVDIPPPNIDCDISTNVAMILSKINNITVGPASTIVGSFILNTILVELAGKIKNIKPFPFYISSNMPNANSNNNILIKKYKKLNKHL